METAWLNLPDFPKRLPALGQAVTIYLAEDHVAIRELLRNHLEMLPEYKVVGESTDAAWPCRNASD